MNLRNTRTPEDIQAAVCDQIVKRIVSGDKGVDQEEEQSDDIEEENIQETDNENGTYQ